MKDPDVDLPKIVGDKTKHLAVQPVLEEVRVKRVGYGEMCLGDAVDDEVYTLQKAGFLIYEIKYMNEQAFIHYTKGTYDD